MKHLFIFLFFCSVTMAVIGPFPGSNSSSGGGGGGGGSGTVTSVGMSVPSLLSVSGSPITSSGTLAVTYSGTALPIANGGTGETTAANAINALLPSQGGNSGKFLTTNGSAASWGAVSASPAGSNTQMQFNDSSSFGGAGGLTYAKTTQSLTITPTGSPNYGTLFDGDTGSPTPGTGLIGITKTLPAASTLRVVDNVLAIPAGSGGGTGYRVATSGGTSSGQFRGFYSEVSAGMSGSTLNPIISNSGAFGYQMFGNTGGSTTGGVMGYTANLTGGNTQIGYNVSVLDSVGANAKSYGIRANVMKVTGSGTAEAVGGFFRINSTDPSLGTAGTSSALVSDNGDTTSPIYLGMDNGSSVFQIQDGGVTVIGSNNSVATHTLNGTLNGGSLTPVRIAPKFAVLPDQASIPLDPTSASTFKLTATGDRTILAPGNCTSASDGQKILIEHTASGGSRTLSLTTGSNGAFRFGTTIAALTATSSGTTDYIGAVCNFNANRWDVIAYVQGY